MAYTRTTKESFNFDRVERRSTGAVYNYSTTDQLINSRSGERMPDWKEKIRLGQNATTPFTADLTKVVLNEPGGARRSYKSTLYPYQAHWQSWSGFGFTPTVKPTHINEGGSFGYAESIALTKTYEKVQSELQQMNSPAFFAEILDVIRQFGKPFDAIIDLTNRRLNRLELERRGLKGSTIFKRKRWAEIVASTYGEYSFGLTPLISDTQKAAEALARFHTEEELHKFRKRIVSRGVEELSENTSSVINLGGTSMKSVYSTKKVTQRRVQYVCGLSAPPIAAYGSNERLLQLLGFDHGNWIPAAWEVVPWSWLIDYFTNVSEILEAGVTSTATVQWIARTNSVRTEWSQNASVGYGLVDWLSLSDNRVFDSPQGHAGKLTSVRTTVDRTVPATLGVPPLYFEHPFKNIGKLANMAAVLISRKPSSSALWLF